MTVISVDLGGTRMRGAILSDEGELLHRDVRPTPSDDPSTAAFVALLRDLAAHPSKPARAIVGVPGRVDHGEGKLDYAPNLPAAWKPGLTAKALGEGCGVPVHLVNDADLAAVGEAYFGAGKGYRDVVFVTISTGVGGGVVLGGKLLVGRRSLAEIGHTVIDREAFVRGEPSTLEELASGTALARIAKARGLAAEGAEIVDRVRKGDPLATAILDEVRTSAAIGIRNVAFAYSPEIVVVGGGLGLNDDLMFPPIRAHLERFGPAGMPIALARATLGDDAGLVGAAALSRAL